MHNPVVNVHTDAPGNLPRRSRYHWYITGFAVVAFIAGLRLLLHLLTATRYGFFRDELYYIACARHLDWGYVDQPPLVPLTAWFSLHVFGSSLFALHVVPALAGAGIVALTGYQAHQLGGKRYAMGLSALGIALAPVMVINAHLLTTNIFEPLIWMGCATVVIKIVQTGNQKLWLWFGALAGIGLQNKYSMAVFGFAVVFGLLLTPERKAFKQPWIWIAGCIALVIFLPNLMWNVHRDWPFVQLMHNIRASGRDVQLNPVQYVLQQILMMGPFACPLWIAGLLWLFFSSSGRRYRVLGWAFVIQLAVFMILHGKDYYSAPAYPMLFAAGGVMTEQWVARARRAWLRPAFVIILVAGILPLFPMIAPVLSVEQYLQWQKALHFNPPATEISHRRSPLPQYYSDQLGWEHMVAQVARIYNNLPPSVRAKTAIKADNYGEAGAIDFFGPKYGLPPAICFHQNYWYWGVHGSHGESVILLGEGRPEHLPDIFDRVEKVGRFDYPYALENFDIYWGEGLKLDLQEVWRSERSWR
jgi:4-amino-4-deoxy-L-arabinose transferase-like glycosyltransferase